MKKKILIANRGEIAVRAIRACREMDIETIAVYSKADKDSLHVKYADRAVCVGENRAAGSYLDIYKIMSAATLFEADAIYPGTGFFSENANFSELCGRLGIRFIGAEAATLKMLGDKILSKKIAKEAGLPIMPATESPVRDADECLRAAREIGFPVIIKAVDGGGGKGIRIVTREQDVQSSFFSCMKEAKAAFNSDKVFVEKFLDDARHVEVQILADTHGNVIHLFDRDCTMQRRNQKLIEEAVSPFVPDDVKQRIYQDAIRVIAALHYPGAATVEFLVDREMNHYFMEVNPRVQVEHPVTELITGADIVKEQIHIAFGGKLSVKTPKKPHGHAIEVRINAEDISNNFMCSTGVIQKCVFPQGSGIRVETFIQPGYRVTPFYDSMLAKIVAWADTRELAIKRLLFALDELDIQGVAVNRDLQKQLLATPEFVDGRSNTTFVQKYIDSIEKNREVEA